MDIPGLNCYPIQLGCRLTSSTSDVAIFLQRIKRTLLKSSISAYLIRIRRGNMYEFHGWIVLRYHTHDTNELLEDEAYNKFMKYIEEVDSEKISSLRRRNGLNSWTIIMRDDIEPAG
ncbi:hypothetical protein GC097_02025 [Paenibacillus sp. LMG 31457]|uniref:Uncharacterized protein n=2 Tax=Paenibacillus planticolens TaxID=2654976 RepID=A0ABX1ZFC6_9BACL|nr:hypothetical protein [Paenibacillus planticolens]